MILRRDFIKSVLTASFASTIHTGVTARNGVVAAATTTLAERRTFPHRVEVSKIEVLTHNIKRFQLAPKDPKKFSFAPGQHVLLRAPADYLADFNERHRTSHQDVYRPYSFASSPNRESHFDLIIKHYGTPPKKDVPPGVVSTYLHKHLKVGDGVNLSEPLGKLYSKNDSDRPVVVVAGGVGAAPFVGLLNYWFENKIDEQRDIYFFLGVRSKQDLLLHAQFTHLSETKKKFRYIPALSHPQEADKWDGETGYINVVLDRYFTEKFDADVYLAGPPIMIKFTRQVLAGKGIKGNRIHRDPIRVR